jgi:ABC-type Zn uptake system ZnuABC Zn-binding protein ZnuA
MKAQQIYRYGLQILIFTMLVGCNAAAPVADHSGKLKVVATTSIVGDVVRNVGGDAIELSILLPTGSDPHSFEPVPQDVARLQQADIIFANGAGLEEFLSHIIDSAGGKEKLVSLSDDLDLIQVEPHEGETAEEAGGGEEHEHSSGNPHVWTDPSMIAAWVDQIAAALSSRDATNSSTYQSNAASYKQQLSDLDQWIKDQVAQVPPERRKLVTDHESHQYFARRYGFDIVGAVIPSFSTVAQPSAQELAELEDTIRKQGVRAIFVDRAVNQALSQRVAQDTGVLLVPVYTESLAEPGGEASTYLDFMRYNTNTIVDSLK